VSSGFRARGTITEVSKRVDWAKNAKKYPLPGRGVKGSVVSHRPGAEPGSKTKTILVLSKRDITALVADFNVFKALENM